MAEYGDISIETGPLDAGLWSLLPGDQPIPLQQYWAYGAAMAAMGSIARQVLVMKAGRPVALGLTLSRRLYGFVGFTTLNRGPLWLEPGLDQDTRLSVLRALRRQFNPWRWNFLALQAELPDSAENTRLLRRAGYRRVMTGYNTAWLDLSPDEGALRADLVANWRNKLKIAEAGKYEIVAGGRKRHQYEWLLDRETVQRTQKGYRALPVGMVEAYQHAMKGDGVLSVTGHAGRDKLAGALFLIHGNSATYHVGWLGEDGRHATGLHNRVLWQAMLALKARGIRFLDLGGFDTRDRTGITRFKLGTGARPHCLTGTWI
ncbi:MAG: GNAT family N-acetyltransferase [Alphaproteobacteria bacterium]|nr:MAG: GNAT family N-acetyltransferase [Alphaproteobacteria bacterium]